MSNILLHKSIEEDRNKSISDWDDGKDQKGNKKSWRVWKKGKNGA